VQCIVATTIKGGDSGVARVFEYRVQLRLLVDLAMRLDFTPLRVATRSNEGFHCQGGWIVIDVTTMDPSRNQMELLAFPW
jgi:hypothetical protein